MARPKPTYMPPPRILTAYQVAALLGVSESTFQHRRPGLEAAGFPARDSLLCGWDAHAIAAWLDGRAGLRNDGGARPGAPSRPGAAAMDRLLGVRRDGTPPQTP